MKNRHKALGLGLVELMVGMVIGMVTLLVVTQVMQSFEGQKRTSTGGNDAQSNGAFALYLLDREIRMAGYGLYGPEGLLCKNGINTYFEDPSDGVSIGTAGHKILPIEIVDGGGDEPDRILIARSDSNFGAIPTAFIEKAKPSPSAVLNVGSPGGLKDKDLFIMAGQKGDKPCTLMQMTDDPKATGKGYNLIHNSGKSSYNPPNPKKVFGASVGEYDIGDIVINMGASAPRFNGFSIFCESLAEFNIVSAGGPTCNNVNYLVSNIVNLQAVYGVASDGGAKIDTWIAPNDWGVLDAEKVDLVRAVRLAVVSRSSQYEKELVTGENLPLWAGGPTIALDEDARHYRYKVFETIIPLRNVIWSAS